MDVTTWILLVASRSACHMCGMERVGNLLIAATPLQTPEALVTPGRDRVPTYTKPKTGLGIPQSSSECIQGCVSQMRFGRIPCVPIVHLSHIHMSLPIQTGRIEASENKTVRIIIPCWSGIGCLTNAKQQRKDAKPNRQHHSRQGTATNPMSRITLLAYPPESYLQHKPHLDKAATNNIVWATWNPLTSESVFT